VWKAIIRTDPMNVIEKASFDTHISLMRFVIYGTFTLLEKDEVPQ